MTKRKKTTNSTEAIKAKKVNNDEIFTFKPKSKTDDIDNFDSDFTFDDLDECSCDNGLEVSILKAKMAELEEDKAALERNLDNTMELLKKLNKIAESNVVELEEADNQNNLLIEKYNYLFKQYSTLHDTNAVLQNEYFKVLSRQLRATSDQVIQDFSELREKDIDVGYDFDKAIKTQSKGH